MTLCVSCPAVRNIGCDVLIGRRAGGDWRVGIPVLVIIIAFFSFQMEIRAPKYRQLMGVFIFITGFLLGAMTLQWMVGSTSSGK